MRDSVNVVMTVLKLDRERKPEHGRGLCVPRMTFNVLVCLP